MDLGIKPQKGPLSEPATADTPYYPMFTLHGDQVGEFLEHCECKKGDVVECTIKLRVTGFRDTKYEKCLEFDAMELSVCEDEEKEEEHRPSYSDYAKGMLSEMKD